LRTFFNFFRDAYYNIKRNTLMSTASIASVVAALIIMGIILILAINVNYLVKQVEESLEMKIYLADTASEERVAEIGQLIKATPHVTHMEYLSKEKALEEFASWFDENEDKLLQGYAANGNPLPRSYVVKVDDASYLEDMYSVMVKQEGVTDAVYGKEYVDVLLKFNRIMNMVSFVIVVILSLVSLFTIYNTIKLTIYARRDDVDIMKYVGASNAYIQMPFIIEGSVLGLIGASVAILLIRGVYTMVLGMMQAGAVLPLSTTLAPFDIVVHQIAIYFLLYGFVIGAAGSLISVSKFLRTSR
jgi:cell division transport system permease protein